jgi:hypothetical protein
MAVQVAVLGRLAWRKGRAVLHRAWPWQWEGQSVVAAIADLEASWLHHGCPSRRLWLVREPGCPRCAVYMACIPLGSYLGASVL